MQQEQVAREARISQQSYSDLETGKSKSTVKIGSLSRVLGVDAYWLETGAAASQNSSSVREMAPPEYIAPDKRTLLAWYEQLDEAKRKAFIAFISAG